MSALGDVHDRHPRNHTRRLLHWFTWDVKKQLEKNGPWKYKIPELYYQFQVVLSTAARSGTLDAKDVERVNVGATYSKVKVIYVSTDSKRGWSGVSVFPDSPLSLIRNIDVDNKIYVLKGNFCLYQNPMRNETFQRQFTLDVLCARHKKLGWVIQVDADEEFLDFNEFLRTFERLPRRTKYMRWKLVQLFNQLDDGRFLSA